MIPRFHTFAAGAQCRFRLVATDCLEQSGEERVELQTDLVNKPPTDAAANRGAYTEEGQLLSTDSDVGTSLDGKERLNQYPRSADVDRPGRPATAALQHQLHR